MFLWIVENVNQFSEQKITDHTFNNAFAEDESNVSSDSDYTERDGARTELISLIVKAIILFCRE